jgi:hypothetical protein
VWYLQDKEAGKLSNLYVGPVVITKKLTDLTYQINLKDADRRKLKKIVHHDKLKPFCARL